MRRDERNPSPTEAALGRNPRELLLRALHIVGYAAAGVVLVLLLSTACSEPPTTPIESNGRSDTAAGENQNSEEDPNSASSSTTDPATAAAAEAAAVIATFGALGASIDVSATVDGPDTDGTASGDWSMCFTTDVTLDPSLFIAQTYRITCSSLDGGAEIASQVTIQVNEGAPLSMLDWSAFIACGDANVTTSGPPVFFVNLPGIRFGAAAQAFLPSVILMQPGDVAVLSASVVAHADLPPGAAGRIEVSGGLDASFDFLTPIPCSSECQGNADCPAGELCELGACKPLRFVSDPLNLDVTLSPDPLIVGQPFDVSFSFDVHRDDLQPRSIQVVVPLDKDDSWNGIAATNQVAGIFSAGPLNRLVLTTSNPDQLYSDLNGNRVLDAGDVTIQVTTAPGLPSSTLIDIQILQGGDESAARQTFPVDFTMTGELFGMFDAEPPGDDTISIEALSVDADSGDLDDDAGLDPVLFELVLDERGEELDCGDDALDPGEECDDGNVIAGDGCAECAVEEGWTCTAIPGEASVCTETTCTPELEVCDGIDNNCNFEIDEDVADPLGEPLSIPCYEGPPETRGQGACRDGKQFCVDGTYSGECEGDQLPIEELCDTIDTNCNGDLDDVPGLGASCEVGVGACKRTGALVCRTTAQDNAIVCDAVPGQPSAETCDNGVDEDCDGADLPCPAVELESLDGVVKASGGKLTLRGVVRREDVTLDPLAGARVRLEQAGGGSGAVEVELPPGDGWTRNKKGTRLTFQDERDGSLGAPSKDRLTVHCSVRKETCTITVIVKGADLGGLEPGDVTTTMALGDDRFEKTQTWREKGGGKKLVTP